MLKLTINKDNDQLSRNNDKYLVHVQGKCKHREETWIVSIARHKATFDMFEDKF